MFYMVKGFLYDALRHILQATEMQNNVRYVFFFVQKKALTKYVAIHIVIS